FGRDGKEGLKDLVADAGDIDAREVNSIPLGDGIVLRVGRYGPYLEVPVPDGEPATRASVPEDLAPDELTPERARELMAEAATTGDDGRPLGTDPATGHEIVVKNGRFGPYVTEILPEADEAEKPAKGKGKGKAAKPKPRTASLFKDMSVETIDLETALKLLSLPRVVGTVTEGEGEDAKEVEITAQNGRYGPYLKKGSDSRSLENEQQIFDITLEEALAIYAQPKRGRGAGTARPPLLELGEDPVSGRPVVVKDGRFGPYVTDGETNATLRKSDPLETLTKERAYELLAEKRAAGPAKRPARGRGTRKTATTSRRTASRRQLCGALGRVHGPRVLPAPTGSGGEPSLDAPSWVRGRPQIGRRLPATRGRARPEARRRARENPAPFAVPLWGLADRR